MVNRQTTQWPKDKQHNGQKTDNTMDKRQTTQWPKDRQHNGQETDNTMAKRQTTQWPKEKNDKTTKRQTTIYKTYTVVCLLAIVLSVFWPLCCLFFFYLRILITPLVSSNSSHDIG
jgi:hypothetical protein